MECNKFRLLKFLLAVCLGLVLVQYLLNVVAYKYSSRVLNFEFLSFVANRTVLSHLNVSDVYSKIGGSAQPVSTREIVSMTSTNKTLTSTSKTSTNHTKIATTQSESSLQRLESTVTSSHNSSELPLCPLVPPNLVGALATYKEAPSFEELAKLYPKVRPGGRYKPPDCTARHRVAIIIPYRNREMQLRILLHNLHPIFERQQIDYGIFVVELAMPTRFNRAILMNIGYVEALKLYDYQCFIFHDVDLIPENDRNLYTCPENPRHMSVAIDKFQYRLPYEVIFGGVSALTKEHLEKTNGFSNKYFGWGGEDDDMSKRVLENGLKISRYPVEIARYKMIKHGRDKGNNANPNRFKLLYAAKKRMKTDGLNSLKYKLLKLELRPLYTWVYVSVDENEIMKS